jgi:hypothetical protein
MNIQGACEWVTEARDTSLWEAWGKRSQTMDLRFWQPLGEGLQWLSFLGFEVPGC